MCASNNLTVCVSFFCSGTGLLILFLLSQDCPVPKVKRGTLVLASQEKMASLVPQVGKASISDQESGASEISFLYAPSITQLCGTSDNYTNIYLSTTIYLSTNIYCM